jgi:hypothetical protein
MLYRRFGFLQARLLLCKQDELRDLEERLDILDRIDDKKRPIILKCRDKDDSQHGERKKLFENIERKFAEYCALKIQSN